MTDGGSATTRPAVHCPAPGDDGGRGLWLVELLAENWGFQHEKTCGKVWFRLAGR
nr:ATP-binding protein [Nonomuraea deserti]